MKELSIEEKAKRYDEALKVLHKYDGVNIMFTQDLKEEMFPELKEYDDEMIMKALIEGFKVMKDYSYGDCTFSKYYIPVTDIIAWLEKQSEHTDFLNKIQIGDKVTRNKDGVLVNLSQLNRVAKKQGKNNIGISEATKQELEDNLNKALEKETPESWNKFLDEQGEQKPIDKVESRQEELTEFEKAVKQVMEEAIECGDTHNLKADADMLLRLAQKPAWSEDDEDIINTIINHFKVDIECTDEDDTVRWLKSLKDRVSPQPKQMWSEEDEETLDYIIDYIEKNKSKDTLYTKTTEVLEGMIDFLKSLKDRYTWKPSDEQMERLKGTINSLPHQEVLYSLYQDLKKL